MKPLKQCIENYIKNHTNESLFDDEDVLSDPDRDINIVKEFLSHTYGLDGNDYEIIKALPKSKVIYIVNIPNDKCYLGVRRKDVKHLTNGMFEFGTVVGSCGITNCPNLESLEGCPREVGGWFEVVNCPNLKSLEHSPYTVRKTYTISKCNNIKKLDGITLNSQLIYLSGLNNLESLSGLEKLKRTSSVEINSCPKIKNLKGLPRTIGNFSCCFCDDLESLEGAPKTCNNFEISSCRKLESLRGGPVSVKRFYTCKDCNLKTLDYCPDKVGLVFGCGHNPELFVNPYYIEKFGKQLFY